MTALRRLEIANFRSLRSIELDLGPLNVLVGPNGAGKTNLLRVIEFLGDSVRDDLGPAVSRHGGIDSIKYWGDPDPTYKSWIRIKITAHVTKHASVNAPDEYELRFSALRRGLLRRKETFQFKRTQGRGRRISITGTKFEIVDEGHVTTLPRGDGALSLREGSLGLSTLPKLGAQQGGGQVESIARLFATFRVFEVDVDAARQPVDRRLSWPLNADASNLSSFLCWLHTAHAEAFELLQHDARSVIPNLLRIEFRRVGGPVEAIVVDLIETGLSRPTPLADASYGSVRALALLAMLHDPDPPLLTCMEEIDHGLHPHAFDRIVERLRGASSRTQFLVATHSPALVNRLTADELIVCERDDETGESLIPAVSSKQVREVEVAAGGDLALGELWFSGSLGGVP